jgi:hypothetical protein
MKTHVALSSMVLAAALLGTLPADARQLQEPRAHMLIDVPDSWDVTQEGRYIRASPQDHSFTLRIVANNRAFSDGQEPIAEEHLKGFLREHLDNITVTTHAHRVDWHNYVGYEVRGWGSTREWGRPGKFFSLVLTDVNNPNKGVVVLGIGSDEGFERHHNGIEEALHTLRAY